MSQERKVVEAEGDVVGSSETGSRPVGRNREEAGDTTIERPGWERGLRVSAPFAAVLLGAALVGCSECWKDGHARTASAPPSARSPARSSKRAAAPPPRISFTTPLAAHEQRVPLPERVLAAEHEARFVVLPDIEVVGRSRTYTGEPSDPNSCAAQCLASRGCDAFAFSKETKVCYLVTQITQSNPDSSFLSGRLR